MSGEGKRKRQVQPPGCVRHIRHRRILAAACSGPWFREGAPGLWIKRPRLRQARVGRLQPVDLHDAEREAPRSPYSVFPPLSSRSHARLDAIDISDPSCRRPRPVFPCRHAHSGVEIHGRQRPREKLVLRAERCDRSADETDLEQPEGRRRTTTSTFRLAPCNSGATPVFWNTLPDPTPNRRWLRYRASSAR